MKYPAIAAGLLGLGLFAISQPATAAGKFACGGPESDTVAEVVKPLIEKAKLCKGLKQKVDAGLFKVKIKIDQTKTVRVEKLDYCTSETSRKIEATVYVACETDADEKVQISVDESFDVMVEIANKDCAVTGFKVEP
ncbi:MAG TPA: hypothetical protein VL101_18005, partial [Nordella sp.]|nr:hypothetical protein [Nordella sp.]